MICSTFYSVLGQGLGDGGPSWGVRREGGGGGGRLGAFWSFLCDVARWLVKSANSTAFSPTIWRKRGPDGDYTREVERVSNAKLAHSTVVSCVRTCSKTTRVTALRMGGIEVARWRENFCCVIPKRVAGVGFATFMEHTSFLLFFENHWFLLVSPSCSRIRRKMMRFWLSRDWLCRCAFCAAAHIEPKGKVFAPRRTSLQCIRAGAGTPSHHLGGSV